jgi:hypothetical protein
VSSRSRQFALLIAERTINVLRVADDFFGEQVAKDYDSAEGEMCAAEIVEPAVALLAELAGEGAVLELGIGTGRLALPLSQREVSGARHRSLTSHGRNAAS